MDTKAYDEMLDDIQLEGSSNAPAPVSPEASAINALAPLTAQATGQNAPRASSAVIVKPELGYIKRNTKDGIPLDVYSGVPMKMRASIAFMRTDTEKQQWLEQQVGPGNVRQADNGDFIVRMSDPDTGTPKDVVVNPYKIDMGDVADALAYGPELVGTILAVRRFGGPGVGLLRSALAGGAGGAAGGAVKDIASRTIHGQEFDFEEIARERGKQGVIDIGAGLALGSAGKAFTSMISPFSGSAGTTADALVARNFVKSDLGLTFPLTPAEVTGSRFLSRAEAFMTEVPGSSAVFDAKIAAQRATTREIQNKMVGLPPGTGENIPPGLLPESSVVGEKAMDSVRDITTGVKSRIASAQGTATKAAAQAIEETVESLVGGGPIVRSQAGKSIMEAASAAKQAWKATSGYKEWFAQAWTHEDNIALDPLVVEAKKILKEISASVPKKEGTGILGPGGTEIFRETTGKVVPSSMIPAGAKARLEQIVELGKSGEAKASLNALKIWREEIDDDILRNSPVAGSENHLWTRLRKSISTTMDRGISAQETASKTPGLSATWQRINEEYAKNAKRFTAPGIKELFREPENALGYKAAVDRAVENPDVYQAYKTFFGENSPQMTAVRRAVMDDLVGVPELNASGMVDIKSFVTRMKSAAEPRNRAEILADIYNGNGRDIRSLVKVLDEMDLTGNIEVTRLEDLMRQYTTSDYPLRNMLLKHSIKNLISVAKKESEVYRNRLVQQISADALKVDSVRPSEFVQRMPEVASKAEITEVLGWIRAKDPGLAQDIEKRAIADIFNRAARNTSVDETMSSILSAMKTPTGSGLKEILGNPTMRENYLAMIGPQNMKRVEALAALLGATEGKYKVAKMAGGMATGTQVSKITQMDLLSVVPRVVKSAVVATIYGAIPEGYLVNRAIPLEAKRALVRTAVMSIPFQRYLIETYGPRAGQNLVNQTRQAVNNFLSSDQDTNAGPFRLKSTEAYDQMLDGIQMEP